MIILSNGQKRRTNEDEPDMRIVDVMTVKYQRRTLRNGQVRQAPGGEDTYRLCVVIKRLEDLVRRMQRGLPEAEQNHVERQLWQIDNLP